MDVDSMMDVTSYGGINLQDEEFSMGELRDTFAGEGSKEDRTFLNLEQLGVLVNKEGMYFLMTSLNYFAGDGSKEDSCFLNIEQLSVLVSKEGRYLKMFNCL